MPTRRFPSSVNPNPSRLPSVHAGFQRQDPREENPELLQTMEDFSMHQLGRLTNTLIKVTDGALTLRDVKNGDRTDYVHENTGDSDKMSH